MDDEQVDGVIDTSESTIETEVISHANPVLTLITTEDGIPTSTEVTVLTTALGDVPLMAAALGTLAEVPLVTSHPTFVTSHHGVGTVYAASNYQGQSMVVRDGQITVLDNDGSQRTIVVHADPSQLSALAQVQAAGGAPSHFMNVSFHETCAGSVEIEGQQGACASVVNEQIGESQNESLQLENQEQVTVPESIHTDTNDVPIVDEPESILGDLNEESQNQENRDLPKSTSAKVEAESSETVAQSMDVFNTAVEETTSNKEVCEDKQVADSPVQPEEVVCLLCYQAFLNPRCKKKDNEKVDECAGDSSSCTSYGRTLGRFFEISRINMSIVTRRSYKDYEVPICQSCNANLVKAEEILEELRRLERELYFIRQTIKDEIISSHEFYKNAENKEMAESRRGIPRLAEILEIVDRIRDDIINDGRPPKVPRSVGTGSKPGRKTKQKDKAEPKLTDTNTSSTNTPAEAEGENEETKLQPSSSENTEAGKLITAEIDTEENEEESKIEQNAIRTSFGRLVKRPTYMGNELTEDELSELGDSSEDNYEEIEIKPDLPPVGEAGENNDDDLDDEDPAWSPDRGLFISERVGIPPSSSDESNFSEVDSDAETLQKARVKKEPKERKTRRSKPNKQKKAKRIPFIKQEDMNYEVKVIQLDGTELMSINASGADDKIGLQPDITQKVMDSQAVIMVKNQLFGKRVQCPHCPRTFTDPQRRDIHVKKKHEGVAKPFECDVCHKRFSRQDHLKNHMKRHLRPPKDKVYKPKTQNSEKNQPCQYCQQRFRNKSELMVHIRTHTGERPYRCEYCIDSFVSVLKREFHIEQMHPHVPPLRCEYCPKGFFRQHRLRIHAVTHTGEKANICELCGKSFSQAAMLRYHQTTHEELNLKQFKCQECNRVFANPQNLKSHMESQHQKMYRHRCPHCEKGYTQMSHLRRHLRTHTGDQPYPCPHCSKRFTSGAALKIHVRIHTGERPYYCSLCEKGFRSKTKLGRHLKTLIHTGEKERIKKETVTAEIETPVDMNVAPTTTWTEIVGIITGV